MAEAPVLSTKNNNNNISPQPWELDLSQRQSGGGEEAVEVVLVFGCPANVARHRSGPTLRQRSRPPPPPVAETSVSGGVVFPERRRPLALVS